MAEEKQQPEEVQENEDSNVHKEKQKEARGVDSVTDYVQEKESAVDANKAQAAIGSIQEAKDSSANSNVVVLKEEDVKLLVDECEISKEAAEELLKKNDGDIGKAIRSYINGN